MSSGKLVRAPTPDNPVDQLRAWASAGTNVWAYFATRDGHAAYALVGAITDVARCLVISDETNVFRFDLADATCTFGPFRAAFIPSNAGVAVAISQRSDGLVGADGVRVARPGGDSVFVCERERAPLFPFPRTDGLLAPPAPLL